LPNLGPPGAVCVPDLVRWQNLTPGTGAQLFNEELR
jgi:hypothetical protein